MQVDEVATENDSDLVITSVRLSRATRNELERFADGYRNGRSAIIREAVEEHLKRLRGETA